MRAISPNQLSGGYVWDYEPGEVKRANWDELDLDSPTVEFNPIMRQEPCVTLTYTKIVTQRSVEDVKPAFERVADARVNHMIRTGALRDMHAVCTEAHRRQQDAEHRVRDLECKLRQCGWKADALTAELAMYKTAFRRAMGMLKRGKA